MRSEKLVISKFIVSNYIISAIDIHYTANTIGHIFSWHMYLSLSHGYNKWMTLSCYDLIHPLLETPSKCSKNSIIHLSLWKWQQTVADVPYYIMLILLRTVYKPLNFVESWLVIITEIWNFRKVMPSYQCLLIINTGVLITSL